MPHAIADATSEVDLEPFATLRSCSRRDAGWSSLLVRTYRNASEAEDVASPPVDDQLIVLVTGGAIDFASHSGGRWRRAPYRVGSIGMTAPGRPSRLQWRSSGEHTTTHVHLPGSLLQETAEDLFGRDPERAGLPDALLVEDPVVAAVVTGLTRAAGAGVDDLYAASAASFLAAHLLGVRPADPTTPADAPRDARILRVLEFMHDNLQLPLTLSELAGVAQLSSFHFLRLFREQVGEPPRRHLNGLRVARAASYLRRSELPVSDIAYLCGFSSPAHLTVAFRREHGTTPTAFRRAR